MIDSSGRQGWMMRFIDRLCSFIKLPGGPASMPRDRSKYLDLGDGALKFECSLGAFAHSDACADLFLNRYTVNEIGGIMERAGLSAHLASLGLAPASISIDRDENRIHRLRAYCGVPKATNLIIQLRLSEIVYTPGEKRLRGPLKDGSFPLIAIEWINLQNPRGRFTAERKRLPGQTHPGLGAVRYIFKILETFARDTQAAGIMDMPEYFHAAAMYARCFSFVDPRREGMLRAVRRDLGGLAFHELAWGFVCGAVIDERSGEPAVYEPAEQIFPLSRELRGYFASKQYGARVADEERARRFRFDRRKLSAIVRLMR